MTKQSKMKQAHLKSVNNSQEKSYSIWRTDVSRWSSIYCRLEKLSQVRSRKKQESADAEMKAESLDSVGSDTLILLFF